MIDIELFGASKYNCVLPFPNNWNELSTVELELISKSFVSDAVENEIKAALFLSLFTERLKINNYQTALALNIDTEDAVLYGLPLIDFIFDSNKLTNQPYPTISIGNALLFGPDNDFDNITCAEFEDCEVENHQFKQKPDIKHLAIIAAILWRPKKLAYYYFDAKKHQYQNYDKAAMVAAFKKLPIEQLYTIYIWYNGCREQLPLYFESLFAGGGGDNQAADIMMFTKCIHSGAGVKNGSRENIRTMLLKEFFFDMNLEAEKVKNIK